MAYMACPAPTLSCSAATIRCARPASAASMRSRAGTHEPFRVYRKIAFVCVARLMVLQNEQLMVATLMLAASGVGFGLRRTVPHMLGVCAGFAVLVLTCGLGVGALIMQSPTAATALKVAGSGYLVFLAWTLRGNAVGAGSADADAGRAAGRPARPMSFAAAAAFQFANPKAWLMGVTAASAFLPALGGDWRALALLCLVRPVALAGPKVLARPVGRGERRFPEPMRRRMRHQQDRSASRARSRKMRRPRRDLHIRIEPRRSDHC